MGSQYRGFYIDDSDSISLFPVAQGQQSGFKVTVSAGIISRSGNMWRLAWLAGCVLFPGMMGIAVGNMNYLVE